MDQTSRKLEVRRPVTFLLQKHKQETVKIFIMMVSLCRKKQNKDLLVTLTGFGDPRNTGWRMRWRLESRVT